MDTDKRAQNGYDNRLAEDAERATHRQSSFNLKTLNAFDEVEDMRAHPEQYKSYRSFREFRNNEEAFVELSEK